MSMQRLYFCNLLLVLVAAVPVEVSAAAWVRSHWHRDEISFDISHTRLIRIKDPRGVVQIVAVHGGHGRGSSWEVGPSEQSHVRCAFPGFGLFRTSVIVWDGETRDQVWTVVQLPYWFVLAICVIPVGYVTLKARKRSGGRGFRVINFVEVASDQRQN